MLVENCAEVARERLVVERLVGKCQAFVRLEQFRL